MHKTITQKDFTVFLLKAFLTILLLGSFFQVSFAQEKAGRPSGVLREKSAVKPVNKSAVNASKSAVKAAMPSVNKVDEQAKIQIFSKENMGKVLRDQSDVPSVIQQLGEKKPAASAAKGKNSDASSAPTANATTATATFSGSLLAGDCVMPFRLFRDGIASACGSLKAFPTTAGGPSHFYDTYSVTNTTGTAACITVSLTTTDLTNANIMAASFLGSFDPANLATNFLADPGLSTGTPATAPLVHGFTLAPGATALIVVFSANASNTAAGTASAYTVTVDGLASTCVAPSTPTVTGNLNTCPGGTATTLSVACGSSLNSAADWKWYTGSCGGTLVGTGKSITVSPTATTTYYVRGEGGCVTPGACASVTVNVSNPSSAAVLSQVQIPTGTTNLINEGFEGAVPPAGWATQNLSVPGTNPTWGQGGALGVFAAQSGTGFAFANFQNTSGTNTISNWMFTPNITLKNGDKFSFYTRTTTGTFPDRLQLRQSTNGASVNVGTTETSVGDFATLLLDINPNLTTTGYPTAWTQFTVTISGVPATGISGRLAFRYFVTGGGPGGLNSDFMGVDNAVYTTPSFSDPTTCTGSTANLKVDITGGLSPYTIVYNTVPATTPVTITNYISGTSIPVTPAATTTYTLVSVTSASGCVGTGNSGTPTITVSPTPVAPIVITANPTGTLCAGDPTLLSVALAPLTPTFSTTAPILISSGPLTGTTSGPAFPYPATLAVAGLPASGATVTSVTLRGLSHTWASDLDILLQSPTGQNVILLSDFGGSNDYNNANLTFSDAGATMTSVNPMLSGTFKCVNTAGPDNFVAPGPGSVTNINPTLASFTGNFNGNWNLFVVDQASGDTGRIANGYSISFNIPGGVPPAGYTYSWSPATGISSTTGNPIAASPASTTTYTLFATAPGGCQTTSTITINVNQLPAVTSQPANVTICALGNATFSATGSGAGITYQWQVSTNGGGSYTNVVNGAPYSGATTPTLTITGVPASFDNNRYRVVISGTCPPAANSTGAILKVTGLPNIAITPSTPVCGGLPNVNGTLITAGSVLPPVPGAVTIPSGAINLAVPDNTANGVNNVLTVAGVPTNATITNVTVKLNMSHTYPGDMIFNLKGPSGQILNLYKYAGGFGTGPVSGVSTWGWYNASVSASGTAAFSSVASAPFIYGATPIWKPDVINGAVTGVTVQNPAGFVSNAGSFTDLYTTAASTNGQWTLAMADGGAGDVGVLASWSIVIDYTTPGATGSPLTYTWSPATGLFTNPAATIPYVAGTPTNQVYAAPTVNTVYTVTGTDGITGCVNTGTVGVTYTPKAPTVNPTALTLCLNYPAQPISVSSSLIPGTTTFSSGPIAVVVPDAGTGAPGISTIPVAGIPANASVTEVKVTFSMSHTWVGDVDVNVQAPNGRILNLVGGLDGGNYTNSSDNFLNTSFSSTGGATISGAAAPRTGTYAAEARAGYGPVGYIQNSTTWANLIPTAASLNGNWILAVGDFGAGDQGTITSWSVAVTYGAPAAGIWSPITGLYLDAQAQQAYIAGTAVNTVYAKPTVSTVYNVVVESVGPDSTKTFSNPGSIATGDGSPGSPYPATITVSGLPTTGAVVKSVTLTGINHTWSDDLDILLQSPTGQNVVLMSDIGFANLMTNLNYTFDDAAPFLTAATAGPSGSYHPTNLVGTIGVEPDNWPAPGPGAFAQTAPALSLFNGNPNGSWKLFVADDATGDFGTISGGYSITFSYPTKGCPSAPTQVPVTVNLPVVITAQPVDAAVCTDKVGSFTTTATGSVVQHNWKVSINNGNTWSDIANGGVYSGVNTATLTITAPPLSMNGYLYKDSIRSIACRDSISRFVKLTVNPLPTITLGASRLRLYPGLTSTIFSTVSPAAGTLPGAYTWLRNGVQVPGSGSSLIVNVDGLGDYTLRVTDVNGCTNTSGKITITDSASGKVFIYPNPNTGAFQVRYYSSVNTIAPRGVNVYDARGKRILTQTYAIAAPYSRMDVDLSNHGSGVYLIEVVDVDGNRLAVGKAQVLR